MVFVVPALDVEGDSALGLTSTDGESLPGELPPMLLLRALIISSKAFFGLDEEELGALATGTDAVKRVFFFGVVVALDGVR